MISERRSRMFVRLAQPLLWLGGWRRQLFSGHHGREVRLLDAAQSTNLHPFRGSYTLLRIGSLAARFGLWARPGPTGNAARFSKFGTYHYLVWSTLKHPVVRFAVSFRKSVQVVYQEA